MRWYRESFNAQTCLFGEVKLLQPQMTKVRLSIIFFISRHFGVSLNENLNRFS